MSDFGEKPTPGEDELKPQSWAANLSGRRVDFPSSEGLSWGIEIDLPIDGRMRSNLSIIGISLPERIDKIRYLDLAPQESLTEELRNIENKRPAVLKSPLEKIARSTISGRLVETITGAANFERPADVSRRREILKIFRETFGNNNEEKNEFNEKIKNGRSSEILIVWGHSGPGLSVIGEQGNNKIEDTSQMLSQKRGNDVHFDEIVGRYNKPNQIAAIIFHSCSIDKKEIHRKDVPIVISETPVGGYQARFGFGKTVVL